MEPAACASFKGAVLSLGAVARDVFVIELARDRALAFKLTSAGTSASEVIIESSETKASDEVQRVFCSSVAGDGVQEVALDADRKHLLVGRSSVEIFKRSPAKSRKARFLQANGVVAVVCFGDELFVISLAQLPPRVTSTLKFPQLREDSDHIGAFLSPWSSEASCCTLALLDSVAGAEVALRRVSITTTTAQMLEEERVKLAASGSVAVADVTPLGDVFVVMSGNESQVAVFPSSSQGACTSKWCGAVAAAFVSPTTLLCAYVKREGVELQLADVKSGSPEGEPLAKISGKLKRNAKLLAAVDPSQRTAFVCVQQRVFCVELTACHKEAVTDSLRSQLLRLNSVSAQTSNELVPKIVEKLQRGAPIIEILHDEEFASVQNGKWQHLVLQRIFETKQRSRMQLLCRYLEVAKGIAHRTVVATMVQLITSQGARDFAQNGLEAESFSLFCREVALVVGTLGAASLSGSCRRAVQELVTPELAPCVFACCHVLLIHSLNAGNLMAAKILVTLGESCVVSHSQAIAQEVPALAARFLRIVFEFARWCEAAPGVTIGELTALCGPASVAKKEAMMVPHTAHCISLGKHVSVSEEVAEW